ncbi:MAG: hypothetical protein K0U12_04185, partial [Gammaproteobacteria bacterium]|nr:hypothetical protein [Gammaproteobacteria bacterium]
MTKQSNTAKLQDHYLHFERQLRQAKSINELGFIACNNSKIFLSFNQVMLWKADNNKAVIQTISGVANLDRNSPMLQWMRQVVEVLMKQTETVFAVDRTSLPKSLNDKWQDWLPPYIICAKLLGPDDSLQGILIVSNEQNFSQSQQQVITLVSEVIGYSMFALRPKRIRFLKRLKNRSTAIGLAITIVVAGILMLPVTQTVLAPAEVTA